MFNKREDAFSDTVKQMKDVRKDLDLPPLPPIETIQEVFMKMSKELRSKLEPTIGPQFKENVAGLMTLMLEFIAKYNQDLAIISIEANRWALDYLRLRDAGKFAVKDLETALKDVDEVVAVLEKHGEERAEDVKRFLRRRITYQILIDDYLPKLPGGKEDPAILMALQEIIPLLPAEAEEVIDAEVIEIEPGTNGHANGFVYQSPQSHWFPNAKSENNGKTQERMEVKNGQRRW